MFGCVFSGLKSYRVIRALLMVHKENSDLFVYLVCSSVSLFRTADSTMTEVALEPKLLPVFPRRLTVGAVGWLNVI